MSGADYAFVELATDRTSYFVGERFSLTLRVGVDAEFFDTRVLQRFQRRLDGPVDVPAPSAWTNDAGDRIESDGPPPPPTPS